MTRTELKNFIETMYNNRYGIGFTAERLYKCSATCITLNNGIKLLKSYNTIVAYYRESTATLFVFDYYSTTTYKHIYKYAEKVGAMRITWLYYKGSNGCIETAVNKYANTHRLTKNMWDIVYNNDFITYIGNIPELGNY